MKITKNDKTRKSDKMQRHKKSNYNKKEVNSNGIMGCI